MVSGTRFIIKKLKEHGFLRKSHQKTYPLDPGSGKIHPGSQIQGVKKHRIPDPQHCLGGTGNCRERDVGEEEEYRGQSQRQEHGQLRRQCTGTVLKG
jgi:hypothetical protein